jgi:hypothetical protein
VTRRLSIHLENTVRIIGLYSLVIALSFVCVAASVAAWRGLAVSARPSGDGLSSLRDQAPSGLAGPRFNPSRGEDLAHG